eukprot:scaffold43242_cov70-Phaeocystis_antarctica.AAC.2
MDGLAGPGAAVADQLESQPIFRRRCPSRASSTWSAISDLFTNEPFTSPSDGRPQPLTVESIIVRWMSITYRGPCIDL